MWASPDSWALSPEPWAVSSEPWALSPESWALSAPWAQSPKFENKMEELSPERDFCKKTQNEFLFVLSEFYQDTLNLEP